MTAYDQGSYTYDVMPPFSFTTDMSFSNDDKSAQPCLQVQLKNGLTSCTAVALAPVPAPPPLYPTFWCPCPFSAFSCLTHLPGVNATDLQHTYLCWRLTLSSALCHPHVLCQPVSDSCSRHPHPPKQPDSITHTPMPLLLIGGHPCQRN